MHVPSEVYYVTGAYLVSILLLTLYNYRRSPTGFITRNRLLMLVSIAAFAIALFVESWARLSSGPRIFEFLAQTLFLIGMALGFAASVSTYRDLDSHHNLRHGARR